MTKQNSTSRFLFGLTIFIGLMPLTFTFSQNGTQLLLDTSFKHIVWVGQAIVLILLLLTKYNLTKNQLIALIALCVLIPFAFIFSENGIKFLTLTKYTSSILSWAIASVAFSRLLFKNKLGENSNF